jgi:hypothetical protein
MGRYSYSRTQEFDVDIDFDLFSVDETGKERTPTTDISGVFVAEGTRNPAATDELDIDELDITGIIKVEQITNYTFDNAIEGFSGRFDDSLQVFAFAKGGETQEPLKIENFTLDLTARYLPENTLLTLADGTPTIESFDSNEDEIENDEIILDEDRIEYIFSSPELEAKGISEVALYIDNVEVETSEGDKSFFDTFQDIQGNYILDTEEERIAATNDIDSILNVISSAALTPSEDGDPELQIRVSGKSANSEAIVSSEAPIERPQQVILEAEDFNDLGDYKVVNFPEVGGEVISLLGADNKTSVPTATATSGPLNLGNLDLNDGSEGDGKYDVEISYFDERDGAGQLDILLNHKGVESVVETIELNKATSSDLPNEDIRRCFVIQDLDISTGDTISIRGTGDKGEQARVDYISFYDDDQFIAGTSDTSCEI